MVHAYDKACQKSVGPSVMLAARGAPSVVLRPVRVAKTADAIMSSVSAAAHETERYGPTGFRWALHSILEATTGLPRTNSSSFSRAVLNAGTCREYGTQPIASVILCNHWPTPPSATWCFCFAEMPPQTRERRPFRYEW